MGDETQRIAIGEVRGLLVGGDIRYVSIGGRPLVERLYGAVRDDAWNTVPYELIGRSVAWARDRWTLRFGKWHVSRAAGIDFRWYGHCVIHSDGTVMYTMRGTALKTFRYNKIGLNCHLPLGTFLGKEFSARGPRGDAAGTLPTAITPQYHDGLRLTPIFSPFGTLEVDLGGGDVLSVESYGAESEVQDHRNWGDGNLKVYCPPQTETETMTLGVGDSIWQRMVFRLRRTAEPRQKVKPTGTSAVRDQTAGREAEVSSGWVATSAPTRVSVRILGEGGTLPDIGLTLDQRVLSAVESGVGPLTLSGDRSEDIASERPLLLRLRQLGLGHLRARVNLQGENPSAVLRQAMRLTASVGCRLDLTVSAIGLAGVRWGPVVRTLDSSTESELRRTLGRVILVGTPGGISDADWVTAPNAVERIGRQLARWSDRKVRVGGGTSRFFTELNRVRPLWPRADLVGFTLNPQVHACDDFSLFDNLGAFRDVAAECHRLFPNKQVVIDDLALVGECGPFGGGPQEKGGRPQSVDVRQGTVLAAAWTLGAIKQLGLGGVDAVNIFETTGARGVMAWPATAVASGGEADQAWGGVYPVWYVLRWLGQAVGSVVRATASSAAPYVDAVVVGQGGALEVALFNGTAFFQDIEVGPFATDWVKCVWLTDMLADRCRHVPDQIWSAAGQIPVRRRSISLTIAPHGVAFLKT